MKVNLNSDGQQFYLFQQNEQPCLEHKKNPQHMALEIHNLVCFF